ncbi:uncharacterized protein LOC135811375 [Sycon ciliatum]|uniref:uncharacterized protein LOC135811375 n=1 Tax=Sycon ciliatum TaxID=27933 RepID=UPI0031F616BE
MALNQLVAKGFLVLLALGISQPVACQQVAAPSCMMEWLVLALGDSEDLQRYENVIKTTDPPLDESSVTPDDAFLLGNVFGGDAVAGSDQLATQFVNCIVRREPMRCSSRRPCGANGQCVAIAMGPGEQSYACECSDGYRGDRCAEAVAPPAPPMRAPSPGKIEEILRKLASLETQSSAMSLTLQTLQERMDALETRVDSHSNVAADLKKLQDSVKAAEQASAAKQIEQDTRLSAMEDALRSLSSKAPAEMDTATDEAQPHATTESPAAPGNNMQTTPSPANLPGSCREVQQRGITTSGQHRIRTADGQSIQVYCEMSRRGGGWTRIGNIDVEDHGSCPGSLVRSRHSRAMCGRPSDSTGGCSLARFSANFGSYTEVMGFVTGYRKGAVDAFSGSRYDPITGPYLDGVSITYGVLGGDSHQERVHHLWSYAAGFAPTYRSYAQYMCPCSHGSTGPLPDYVQGHWYCTDYGVHWQPWQFRPRNHLWSASGSCHRPSQCCPGNDERPWFYRNLSSPVQSEIQLRLCLDELPDNEDIVIDRAAIFVR